MENNEKHTKLTIRISHTSGKLAFSMLLVATVFGLGIGVGTGSVIAGFLTGAGIVLLMTTLLLSLDGATVEEER